MTHYFVSDFNKKAFNSIFLILSVIISYIIVCHPFLSSIWIKLMILRYAKSSEAKIIKYFQKQSNMNNF